MLRNAIVCALVGGLVLSLSALKIEAFSDPVGIYARIDKVVLEPNESAPERIQIWGAFAMAKDGGSTYEPASRGYLYFSLAPGKERICRKEWADLKAIAGTDQIVAFGSRWSPSRLRKTDEKPALPDVYPVANGLVKMNNSEYEPIRELKALPKGQR